MDYGKSGSPKNTKASWRHMDRNVAGTDKNPYARTAPKPELLARLKALAEAKKTP